MNLKYDIKHEQNDNDNHEKTRKTRTRNTSGLLIDMDKFESKFENNELSPEKIVLDEEKP